MSNFPQNYFQAVTTFNKSHLALLSNTFTAITTSNKKFEKFNETMPANLGQTVNFDIPQPLASVNGLVAGFQGLQQGVQPLTVSQSQNVSYTVSDPDRIFNVDKKNDSYMPEFIKWASEEFGSVIEADILNGAISNVVSGDINSSTYGLPDTASGPFRFYGDGITAINTYQQYQQAVTNFKDLGSPRDIKIYIPITEEPPVIGSGLNQFAMTRNDKDAQSWEIGAFGGATYYRSNLLPIHYAGNVGVNQTTLTLVSTNDSSGANVTQLTLSGAGISDTDAVKAGDLGRILFNITGQADVSALTFYAKKQTRQPVQFRITANAGSNGSGNVTITITPALVWAPGANQNISSPLTVGMQIKLLPTHQAGLLIAGDAFYLAMPKLPNQPPYPTSVEQTKGGASCRLTYGTIFGQAEQGLIHDGIWGSTIVPRWSMRFIYPFLN